MIWQHGKLRKELRIGGFPPTQDVDPATDIDMWKRDMAQALYSFGVGKVVQPLADNGTRGGRWKITANNLNIEHTSDYAETMKNICFT
jgi:hypothetical protein